ncbi:Gamma-glutamyltransferase 7 [Pteropus alecto]|uniref:Gamma-glutamyltransferase 7 n=1 Tax=Pteropus alecto TaxID=9402 RepID=L5K0U7_PTEAL|nr:Gamma-glutamyltransferase 7 [Pteropus alecto]
MAAENDASQESALGAYSPVDYMSITSFPRLPEDEPAPAAPLRGRKDEDAFLGDPDTGSVHSSGSWVPRNSSYGR